FRCSHPPQRFFEKMACAPWHRMRNLLPPSAAPPEGPERPLSRPFAAPGGDGRGDNAGIAGLSGTYRWGAGAHHRERDPLVHGGDGPSNPFAPPQSGRGRMVGIRRLAYVGARLTE